MITKKSSDMFHTNNMHFMHEQNRLSQQMHQQAHDNFMRDHHRFSQQMQQQASDNIIHNTADAVIEPGNVDTADPAAIKKLLTKIHSDPKLAIAVYSMLLAGAAGTGYALGKRGGGVEKTGSELEKNALFYLGDLPINVAQNLISKSRLANLTDDIATDLVTASLGRTGYGSSGGKSSKFDNVIEGVLGAMSGFTPGVKKLTDVLYTLSPVLRKISGDERKVIQMLLEGRSADVLSDANHRKHFSALLKKLDDAGHLDTFGNALGLDGDSLRGAKESLINFDGQRARKRQKITQVARLIDKSIRGNIGELGTIASSKLEPSNLSKIIRNSRDMSKDDLRAREIGGATFDGARAATEFIEGVGLSNAVDAPAALDAMNKAYQGIRGTTGKNNKYTEARKWVTDVAKSHAGKSSGNEIVQRYSRSNDAELALAMRRGLDKGIGRNDNAWVHDKVDEWVSSKTDSYRKALKKITKLLPLGSGKVEAVADKGIGLVDAPVSRRLYNITRDAGQALREKGLID